MIIDVFHDLVCPWCRIGKRQLDLALAEWDGEPVSVRWRPFFLDEAVPREGIDFRTYMAARKGGHELEPMFETVRRAGERVGLVFRFDRLRLATNTLPAHGLVALAPEERRGATIDALHRAYFEDGRNIGDPSELVAVAGEVGLDVEETATGLGDTARLDAVKAEAAWARDAGVTGVPLFVIDGEAVVSGAQPAASLLRAMRTAGGRAVLRRA